MVLVAWMIGLVDRSIGRPRGRLGLGNAEVTSVHVVILIRLLNIASLREQRSSAPNSRGRTNKSAPGPDSLLRSRARVARSVVG